MNLLTTLKDVLDCWECERVLSDLLINKVRTAIAELEKAEPVAWIHPMDIGRFGSVTFNRDSCEQIPLYTHAPAVPEGMVLVPIEPTEEMWNAGSSALPNLIMAYKAMLNAAPKGTQ